MEPKRFSKISKKLRSLGVRVKSFLFENQNLRQTFAKNTFWLTVSNLGGRLIRAIIIIYAARVLGAPNWGLFSYALTIATVLTVFVDMGINSIVARETAKAKDVAEQSEIVSTSLWLKIILLFLGVLVVIFVAPRFSAQPEANPLLPLIALILVFDALREFGMSYIRGIEKMELETALFTLTNVAIVIFGFLFLHHSRTPYSFTLAYVLGTAVGMAATFFTIGKKLSGFFKFAKRLVKPIITSAWPFAISGLLGMLLLNTDILIIGWLRSAAEVGFYSAANRIIQVIYLIPAVLALSILPAFSRLAHQDDQKMRTTMERVISILFLVAVPVAVGGVILGLPIMTFVFGNSYFPGATSFQILMITILIDFPAVILSYAVFAYNRQKNLIIYSAIGGTANVILDFILIPRLGIAGSAWATLISQFLSNAYLWHVMKKINYFEVLPYLKKIIASSLIMTLVTISLLLLKTNLILNVLISAVVYFACLRLFKEPILKEVKVMLQSHLA